MKDKKNKLETNLYNVYIIEKFTRIYENISVPYKANYEQIIVASYLKIKNY